ncbi:hypothetical protein MHYP_G00000760 [Metynnis hypsauchen]
MEAGSLRRPVKVFGKVRDYPAERRTSDRDTTGTRDAQKRREENPGWRCLTSHNKYSRRSCSHTNLLFLQNGRDGNRSSFRFSSPPERFRRTAAGEAGARHLYEDLPAPSRLIYRSRFVTMKRSCGSGCYRERRE